LALLTAACSTASFDWRERPATDVVAYRQSFVERAGARLVATCAREQLLDEIAAADTLWLGDHHRHSLLHGLHLELLEQVQRRGARLAFGLEAIGTDDEHDVDAFLRDEIDMPELRARVKARWDGSWLDDRQLDPWYFQSLLEFAKRNMIPVFALEPTPRLELPKRDVFMAHAIELAAQRLPDHKLVVVVGQTHLVGRGDLIARTGRDGVALGALPTEVLIAQPDRELPRGALWRSDEGLYWFGEMFTR